MIKTLRACLMAVAILAPVSGYAQQAEQKACGLLSATKLPAIPGLQIASVNFKASPSGMGSLGPKAMTVEIAVKAATFDAVYSYLCDVVDGKSPITVPMGFR